MADIERIYTETPLIDEIVYQIKGMIMDGIVLKDIEEANNNETLYSIKMSDKYADIVEGKDKYELWEYDYDTIIKLPSITKEMAIMYAMNNALIDDASKPLLLKYKQEEFMETYEEQNNYYRMLNGLPDVGDRGILLTDDQISRLNIRFFDVSKHLHEMSNNEINLLDTFGILDEIKEANPTKRYLWHLGEKKIDPYMARKTLPFGLLYLPACESTEVYTKFKDRLEINRVFFLQTMYSQAYKFQSDYYNKFIMCMIIIHSFADMIELSPEYIIQRELFDMRTIQYVFESQGVEFFPDIPLKYQKRLVKNLNRLIKYKSCDKNLIDIASLFGFDNVELFKYYILKDPIMLEDGTYKHDTYEDPKTGEDIEDLEANYELKFLKVNIDGGIAEEAIRDPFNLYDYDDIVTDDVYWNGPYTPEYVKHEILTHEFNMVMSKYIGLEVTYSLTELALELSYFINMILYANIDMSALEIEVPELNSNNKFPLFDLLIGLYSLMYTYLGIKDTIIYNPVQALDVCGFNFETDMETLAEYVAEKGFTLEELGVAGWMNPSDTGVFTFNQLIEVYTNNINIYKHLVHEMYHADDKNIYDIYRKLFQSLMITKLNFEYFRSYGTEPETYLEFLGAKNSPLYEIIYTCKQIETDEERKTEASKLINYIVDNIYIYIEEEEFRYIFHNIPTVSMDYLRQYLFKVLNFFKSYKVDFTRVNVVYTMDDRYDNKINIIDRILYSYIYTKPDKVDIDDYIKQLIHMIPKDKVRMEDMIASFDITHSTRRVFKDYIGYWDRIKSIIIHILFTEYGSPYDDKIAQFIYVLNKADVVKLDENPKTTLSITFKDDVSLEDSIDKTYI